MADFNPLSILDQIPGVKGLEDAAKALGDIAGAVEQASKQFNIEHALTALQALGLHPEKAAAGLKGVLKPSWSMVAEYGVGTLFREYLEIGLGLNYDTANAEAKRAIQTIDTMLTFSTAFPLVIKGVDAALNFFLGQRAPKLSEGMLGKISEEMGLTWAMGQTIDRCFEAAVGNKLEEAILHQKRPIDPELQVMRLMMKQHILDTHTFEERAAHMGYSDDWVKKFGQLADALLPVGDLQQLWMYDLISRGQVTDGMEALGFNQEARDHLTTLYIDKAQTTGGAQLRSIARDLALKGLISRRSYEGILEQTKLPAFEIHDALAAFDYEESNGRSTVPLSAIKAEYEHGIIVDDQARPMMRHLGYSEDAIDELLKTWKLPRLPHPMSSAKVLTYWNSGVITDRADAYTRLVATGLRDKDADFLLDHPPAAGARKHALTPGLLVQAFLDGIITKDDLPAKLEALGVPKDAAQYQTDVAVFRQSRQKRPAGEGIPLTASEIVSAWHVGIFDQPTAIMDLMKLGYSSENALLLLELKNKGPIQSGGGGQSMSLTEAIGYMEAHGYAVVNPPDPQLLAAEAVLSAAGYSWTRDGAGIGTLPGGIPGYRPPTSAFPVIPPTGIDTGGTVTRGRP